MTELSPEFQSQQDEPELPQHLAAIHRDIIRLYFTYIDTGAETFSCFRPELLEDEQLEQFEHELKQVWIARIWKRNLQGNAENYSERDAQFKNDYTEIEKSLENLTTDQIYELSDRIQARQTAEKAVSAPIVEAQPQPLQSEAAEDIAREAPSPGARKRFMRLGRAASSK